MNEKNPNEGNLNIQNPPVNTDIDYKLVISSLKESEEKYRLLFENMTSGFQLNEVITDENGEPIDFRFLDGNSLIENYTGYSIEQVRGKTIKEIIPESDSEMIKKYGNVALTGEGFNLEYFSKTFQKYFKIRTYSPKKGLFAVVFNDISERKQTEIEIQKKNEKLQQLNDEKDKFFSIIAHDLRSPFTSIRSLSNMLDEAIETNNQEEAKQLSEMIVKLANNATDLLSNLMEWARSQTGRMEFKPELFEITNLISEITNFFNLNAEQKSIELTKQLPLRIEVFADKAMVSTIIRNLISNAIKFTRPGGKIIISAEEKQDEIIVSVSDNGVGIHEKALNKIFQISGMYSSKGTQNEMGTGLGLILCKEFIEKHHGKIQVESEPGVGSRFYFSLPKQRV
ncbi:MAG: PAS domain-containing sensor histidine kinase [Bacteroidota bacterium]|nr:PAS domain-containing sensor histidine kinase [Bacteroidota bacterium]